MAFSLKKSIFLVSYGEHFAAGGSMRDAVLQAKADGFSAVEPFPFADCQSVAEAEALGSFCRDEGMEVCCFSDGVDLVTMPRDDAISYMTQRIDMAHAMGSPFMHHTIFPNLLPEGAGGLDFHVMLQKAVPVLQYLCNYAADKGMLCLYENQGFYFNGVAGMGRLVEALDGVPFGLCADVGNCQFVDEPAEAIIGAFSGRIRHVHCKDYLRKSGQELYPGKDWYMTRCGDYIRDTVMGSGIVNYGKILRLLDTVGYDGWMSVEVFSPEAASFRISESADYLERACAMLQQSSLRLPG